MFKFGDNASREAKQKERKKDRAYRKLRQDILESSNYGFNFEASPIFQRMTKEAGISSQEMQKHILERFWQEEKALPGKLGEKYAALVYSPQAIADQLEAGTNFHEAIATIAREIRERGLVLEEGFVKKLVAEAEERYLSSDVA